MASWFDSSISYASGISIPSISLSIRNSKKDVPSSVSEFKKIVNEQTKEKPPDKCINYYMKEFDNIKTSKLQKYGIYGDLAKIIRYSNIFIDYYFEDISKASKLLSFLNSSLRIFISARRTDKSLFKIVIKIAQTNDEQILHCAAPFVQSCLMKKELLTLFFRQQQLVLIWSNIFILHQNTNQIIGPIINCFFSNLDNNSNTAAIPDSSSSSNIPNSQIEIKSSIKIIDDVSQIIQFLDKVYDDFNSNNIEPILASNAFLFLGLMIKSIYTGDFLPSILEFIQQMANFLDNFDFFEPFIVAPTSDPPSIWAAIDAICADPDISIDLLNSALNAIHKSDIPPCPEVFSFNSFIPRMSEISDEMQKMLFEVIEKSEIETKADFLCYVMPLSQTNINTKYLLDLYKNMTWTDVLIDTIIEKFLIEPGFEEVELCLCSDENIFLIAYSFIKQIPKDTQNAKNLFTLFTCIVSDSNFNSDSIQNILSLFYEFLVQVNPEHYMKDLISLISNGADEQLIKTFSAACLNNLQFTQTFIKYNGVQQLKQFFNSTTGLDFIAAVVVDGPYKEIDEYVFELFDHKDEDEILPKFDKKQIFNLMMGLPQGSNETGLLRIPALCVFIEDVPLFSPHDIYIYGSIATKYFKPNAEQIKKFAFIYMTNDLAFQVFKDHTILPSISNPSLIHSDIYEFHSAARNGSIYLQRPASFSFWFNVLNLKGQSVLASFHGGKIVFMENSYISFASKSVVCSIKEWHMISLTCSEKRNNQRLMSVFFDGQKLSDILITSPANTLTIGSKNSSERQSEWIMTPYVYISQNPETQTEIKHLFELGPRNPSSKRIKCSEFNTMFVPYRGFLKYMHIFGGPSFIFQRMLEAENHEEFLNLLQTSFNLMKLGCYSNTLFYSSINYILSRKSIFLSSNVVELIVNQLSLPNGFNWKGFYLIFNHYSMLSSSTFKSHIIIDALISKKPNFDDLKLFHSAVDAFCIFDIDTDTLQNLIRIIKLYLQNGHKELLRKLADTLAVLPFFDTDTIKVNLYDERVSIKQKILYDIIVNDKKDFKTYFDCKSSFLLMNMLHRDLATDFFLFLSKIFYENPEYFDISAFKSIKSFYFYLVQEEKFWIAFLIILMNYNGNKIDDFLGRKVHRVSLFPIFIDLVTFLIPFDVLNPLEYSENDLKFTVSYKMLGIIDEYIVNASPSNIYNLLPSIQNLCSLGFGENKAIHYPFKLSKKKEKGNNGLKLSNWSHTIFSFLNNDIVEDNQRYIEQCLHDIDSQLYEETKNYMEANPIEVNSADIIFDNTVPKVNFDEKILQAPHSLLIAQTAMKSILLLISDPFVFRKALIHLTLYGADVLTQVAICMHQKIIIELLANSNKISCDSLNVLLDFLSARVLEGWWSNNISHLMEAALSSLKTFNSCTHSFILTCLQKVIDSMDLSNPTNISNFNNLIKIGYSCVNSPISQSLLLDSKFLEAFHHFLYALNSVLILENSDNQTKDEINKFLSFIIEKLTLIKGFQESISYKDMRLWINEEIPFSESYKNYYNEIFQSAIMSNSNIIQERDEITLSPKIDQIRVDVAITTKKIAYLRRALRFELFARVNKSTIQIERAIYSLFKISTLLDHSSKEPQKFSIAPSPHPMVVPTKMIPLLFEYQAPYRKGKNQIEIPQSHSVYKGFSTSIKELNKIIVGPKCLEDWELPPKTNAAVAMLFKSRFNAVYGPFVCNMLLAPDVLKSVAVQSSSCLHVLLNATISSTGIVSLIDKVMLCHYPIIENAMHGIYGEASLFLGHVVLNIPFSLMTMAIPRTYLYEPTAIDIFTAAGCHFTFILSTNNRKVLCQQIHVNAVPNARRSAHFAYRLYSKPFEAVTKMWTSQLLSNYDYLLYLNMVSGRSFNDFSQYPVFPWTIGDFSSSNPLAGMRDLSKPMGQQTPKRLEHYDIMYAESNPHYNYGTHYSYPANILFFMMRVEPYTLYSVMLHAGFDHPDRQFFSIDESYRSASEVNQADVRELIPELYTFPEMFINSNKIDLQKRTDGKELDTVILPSWGNDPQTFVWQMRIALESQNITKNLPSWIDLIFGYKQRGQAAIEAKNVFHPLSYDTVEKERDSPIYRAQIESIRNFGQCPIQLLEKPHPSQNIKPRNNLMSIETISCMIKQMPANCFHIRVYDEEVYASANLSHYMGSPPILVQVNEGYFTLNGNTTISVDQIFDITSSSISSDNSLLTITTGSGMVMNYYLSQTNVFSHISGSLIPGKNFLTSAVSSHYGLVCAASDKEIYLFDLPSGFLMKSFKTESIGQVEMIKFDEVHDFIIVSTIKNKIVVFRNNLNEDFIAETELVSPIQKITSLSTTDSEIWIPRPFFATGHENGEINLWEISPLEKLIIPNLVSRTLKNPITAIKIFKHSKALVAIDVNGMAATVSIEFALKLPLRPSFYDKCAACMKEFSIENKQVVCSLCGLPYCRQCVSDSKPNLCKRCEKEDTSKCELCFHSTSSFDQDELNGFT
ncbi:Beige/BEACH domain containing protein [Tritrichomonas foetus]|uniref:Beige/BEACH domain containing protein n=1 Tax=Tritrichomonas foetus TaxID=1144522 RepID=A0A1J4KRC5_9EUKA|nr:Beige/BEACH domain containing protein [Tritrichomonas foetus]|eukprot:OHT13650.1 Beige/BEACH domain containing protein [Tritrichomonas foetus]